VERRESVDSASRWTRSMLYSRSMQLDARAPESEVAEARSGQVEKGDTPSSGVTTFLGTATSSADMPEEKLTRNEALASDGKASPCASSEIDASRQCVRNILVQGHDTGDLQAVLQSVLGSRGENEASKDSSSLQSPHGAALKETLVRSFRSGQLESVVGEVCSPASASKAPPALSVQDDKKDDEEGGIINALERTVAVDINGDGNIGGVAAAEAPPALLVHDDNKDDEEGGIMNALERKIGMDINGDGTIGGAATVEGETSSEDWVDGDEDQETF